MTENSLQRLLNETLAPPELTDAEIEQLDGAVGACNSDSLDRIASGARELINTPGVGTNKDLANPVARQLTVQSSGGRQIPPRNRTPRGAVAALTVSAMSLIPVMFWT